MPTRTIAYLVRVTFSGRMYSIDTTPTAAKMLAMVPGLRARVEEVLSGILATAEEIGRLQGRALDLQGHLRVQVAGHMIMYALDLDRRSATVVLVERLRTDEATKGPTS